MHEHVHEIDVDGERVQVTEDQYMAILAILTEPEIEIQPVVEHSQPQSQPEPNVQVQVEVRVQQPAIPTAPEGEGWHWRCDANGSCEWVRLQHKVAGECLVDGCHEAANRNSLHPSGLCLLHEQRHFDLVHSC